MKKRFSSITFVCLSAMLLLTACDKGKFPGYNMTADGLYYKFYHQDATAQQPQPTDFLKLQMSCYLNDSLYYDFQSVGRDVYTQLTEPKFAGDLQEAYAMMHVGDSASFYVKADSIAIRYYNQDPVAVGLKPSDYFRYEVKLCEVKTQADLDKMAQDALPALKAASEQALSNYVEQNGITDRTASGLYYARNLTTKGAMVNPGQTAVIRYEAYFLDGTPLGNSDQLDGPYEVEYGKHKVLAGLEEAIGLLHVGEKGRFVLPYTLAYGEHPYGIIPACSNLIFDVELLEIK